MRQGSKTQFIEGELDNRCKYLDICKYKASEDYVASVCHRNQFPCIIYRGYEQILDIIDLLLPRNELEKKIEDDKT